MTDAGKPCTHDLAEREIACADGYCPLCSSFDLATAQKRLAETEQRIQELEYAIKRWKEEENIWQEENLRLKEALKRIRGSASCKEGHESFNTPGRVGGEERWMLKKLKE